jgi:hypothetical protein
MTDQVAKIGKRIKSDDPLPPSIWRYQLRRLAYWVLIAFLGMLFAALTCAVYAS